MQKCDILVRNVRVLTPQYNIADDQYIAICDNKIVAVGNDSQCLFASDTVIRGNGKLAMPGLVDSHVHACQYLLRGRLADEYPMVWTRILVPFESSLTERECYISGKLTYLQQIKSGITTGIEAGGNHMHSVAEAAIESGIRAVLTRSTMDQGAFIPASWQQTWKECISRTEALYRDYNGAGDGRLQVWYAMRQIMSCSPALLEAIAARSAELGVGVHAHLAEHKDEISYCLQNFKKRPIEVLEQFGLANERLVCAHNVLLSERDMDLLAQCGARLCHCPRANLGNHGIPKTPALLNRGISIGIGSDGASGCNLDLFEELRLLRFTVQASQGLAIFDPVVLTIKELLNMLIWGGARAARMEDQIGRIQEGYLADIILINVMQPHIWPTSSLINVLVEGVRASDVTDSIINGKVVMRNREVLTLDEEKILHEAETYRQEIFSRINV